MLNLNFQNGQAPALNARNMNAIVESINTLGYAVGGPNVASTVSAMTDTSKVYVYTGSETGYTAGNWYYYNGSAWVSGGVYQAAAVETDTTLTMPGEPADAKATGDAVADLKNDSETNKFKHYMSNGGVLSCIGMDNTLAVSDKIPITDDIIGAYFELVNNITVPSTVPSANTVCAVNRYHLTYLSEMNYSTIFDVKMSQYTSNDNNIIDLCKAGWGRYYGNPENAKGYFGCSGRAESGDVIKIKYTLFYKNNDISITDRFVFTSNEYIYYTNGTKGYSNNMSSSNFVDISDCSYICFTDCMMTNVTNVGSAFYDENREYIQGQKSYQEAAHPENIPNTCRYRYRVLKVPENAKYIRVTGFDYSNPDVDDTIYNKFQCYAYKKYIIINDNKNIEERIKLFISIKFKPSVDLVRVTKLYENNYKAYFKANTEYTGLPYSESGLITSWGYAKSYIEDSVPLETFLSSLPYPNSGLYQLSKYNGSSRLASIYGAVCSSFVCYILGLPTVSTTYMKYIPGLELIDVVNNIPAYKLKKYDVLLKDGHTAIIYDIKENIDGALITVAESTIAGAYSINDIDGQYGGMCRMIVHDEASYYAKWGADYKIYRYKYTNYIQPPDKTYAYYLNNMYYPLIPYMGNKFTYIKGKILNSTLLIDNNSVSKFTSVKILKNESNWKTLSIDDNTTSIDAAFTDCGLYEAYLCKEVNNTEITSVSCSWYVSNITDISTSTSSGVMSISCKLYNKNEKVVAVLFGGSLRIPAIDLHSYNITSSSSVYTHSFTVNMPTYPSSVSTIVIKIKNTFGYWYYTYSM